LGSADKSALSSGGVPSASFAATGILNGFNSSIHRCLIGDRIGVEKIETGGFALTLAFLALKDEHPAVKVARKIKNTIGA
jgi:hypothetical protein